MPSLYTHYLLGQEVIDYLPQDCQDIIRKNKMLYNLGLQGPDFFFYASVFGNKNISKFGNALHEIPAQETLQAMIKHLGYVEGELWGNLREDVLAYLFGFIGHFTLDTFAHPYVFKVQRSERDHLALETDFDQYLLKRRGKVPWKENLKYTVKTDSMSRKTLEAVYGVYQDQITSEEVSGAAKSIYIIRSIMTFPTRSKYYFLLWMMDWLRLPEKFKAMFIFPPEKGQESEYNWPERPEESFTILLERYAQAKEAYPEVIEGFRKVLEEGAEWPAIFSRDFAEIGSE